jgi:hypothetical protein
VRLETSGFRKAVIDHWAAVGDTVHDRLAAIASDDVTSS